MSIHAHHSSHMAGRSGPLSQTRLGLAATLHCLSGCAIGEVAGMIIGTVLGWGSWETVGLAVILAFITGFGLTMIPLLRNGMALGRALRVAFAADFISVTIMEIVDNAVMMAIPGAMAAGIGEPLFWTSLGLSLVIAFFAAWPVNIWLISRRRGHAVVHHMHGHH